MRKFLKQLQKGLRAACVTAALATCWQIGQPINAYAAVETVRFSGTISPTVHDLSHVYLIFGLGYSAMSYAPGADRIAIGDYYADQNGSFSFTTSVNASASDTFWWMLAGIYGDTTGGQNIEGVNGVTLGIDASIGDSWNTSYYYLYRQTEEAKESFVFQYLLNDQPELLFPIPDYKTKWHGVVDGGLEINQSSMLFDFSSAGYNGEIHIQSQIIPEPMTILLLASGGIVVFCRNRIKV